MAGISGDGRKRKRPGDKKKDISKVSTVKPVRKKPAKKIKK